MQCHYFDAGTCRSCTLLPVPYATQLRDAGEHCRTLLPSVRRWLPTVSGPETGFRNKAKLVVGGTVETPTLGILDLDGHGVDLRHCDLYEPALAAAIPLFATFVSRAGLEPYSVPGRSGELKYVLLTLSPDHELMVRFVLRSERYLEAIRAALPWLTAQLPGIAVVSANIHPEHKAVVEGDREITLSERSTLPMRLGALTLHLRPRSFFQTNTVIAAALYRQASGWLASEAGPIWDLYCGVGGFALHLAEPHSYRDVSQSVESEESARLEGRENRSDGEERSSSAGRGASEAARKLDPAGETRQKRSFDTSGEVDGSDAAARPYERTGLAEYERSALAPRDVVGVELSEDAVASARRSARQAGLRVEFVTADATAWAVAQDHAPRAVVVNPPRRGIGPLAAWLE